MRKLAHWTEEYTESESLDLLRELARTHAELSGPFRERLLAAIRDSDFRAICEVEVAYDAPGLTAEEAYHARQARSFFEKLEPLDLGVSRETVARLKFLDSELKCKQVNELFRRRTVGHSFSPKLERVLHTARQKISAILGKVPTLDRLEYRFGPGATTATTRKNASLRHKLSDGVHCSEELYPLALSLLREMPGLCEAAATSIRYDSEEEPDFDEWPEDIREDVRQDWLRRRYTAGVTSYEVPIHVVDGYLHFVPKSWKTYRSIVVEPVLNGLYQLALGDHMTKRLAQAGVDLRDQSLNQRRAMQGSLRGDLATLDLSSASDSIAIEVVAALLPLDLYLTLARGRSGHVVDRVIGRITLQKFSSMGNGYTFPLESLIFYALCHAALVEDRQGVSSDEWVSVYGDDIIVPTENVDFVVEVLTHFGFSVNGSKSFSSGPFRESCGADYFRGFDIRPYYQKTWVSARTLFSLHNFYVRRHRYDLAERVKQFIHPALQIYGPDGYGDGHLLSEDQGLRRKPSHRDDGYGGYVFDTFTLKGRRDYSPRLPGDKVLNQYAIYRRAGQPLLPDPTTRSGKLLSESLLRGSVFRVLDEVTPLPEFQSEDGDFLKATDLPSQGETEKAYKRISIYTFGA